MPKIKVHEKALAHLSRGLYRSPASALRELVSNAWDANARVVRIDTGLPNFFQLSVEDDGDGFTKEQFRDVMEGGIGNSEKRGAGVKALEFNRPVIGRLGIGMLGIAQISLSFTVTSTTKSGEGFRARVRLYDLLKEQLDAENSSLIEEKQHEDTRFTEVDIGQYQFEGFDPKGREPGTIIIADDVHPT